MTQRAVPDIATIVAILNPNYHGPLKLLNHHGVESKTWFMKHGPFFARPRDYRRFKTKTTVTIVGA